MNKWDLSEKQYWVLIWAGLFLTIILISGMIATSTNQSERLANDLAVIEKKSENDLTIKMLKDGYVRTQKRTCVQYTTDVVWDKASNQPGE